MCPKSRGGGAKFKGFTLAEVLITLAIIGVVAALTIPSVIANTQQQEFKTGLKKAVSVLNSAITMNIALEGESPRENNDLFNYLTRHMSLISRSGNLWPNYWSTSKKGCRNYDCINENFSFYTTDGMRFELHKAAFEDASGYSFPLYETSEDGDDYSPACTNFQYSYDGDGPSLGGSTKGSIGCGGCGHFGLDAEEVDRYYDEPNGGGVDTQGPCIITVDVNGDRKPSPPNAFCKDTKCVGNNYYKYSDANGKRLSDVFSIMITDKDARPYGVAAQKAMYNTQK